MGKITAAIFDMDGLMVDTESLYYQTEFEVARRYGKTFTLEVMKRMVGHKGIRTIEIMMETLGIEGSAEEIEALRDRLFVNRLRKGVEPMDGFWELLDWLEAKGYRKAVATSSRRIFKDIIFDRLNLRDRFEVVVTGEEVVHGKPSPEIYQVALNRLRLTPEQCIVLEDSVPGLKAAKAAGCFCIAVPNRFTQGGDFSGADLVAPHLLDKGIQDRFQDL